MVTAEMPAFAKPGQRLDVTVSAIGKAKSLRGGTLVLMPLYGADQQIYAMAQGNLAVGGLGVSAAEWFNRYGEYSFGWSHCRRRYSGAHRRHRF